MKEEKQNKPEPSKAAKIVGGIIFFIIVIVVIGNFTKSPASNSTAVTTSATSTPVSATKDIYAVNEAAKIGSQALTVTAVQRNYASGNPYIQPDTGNEYILVTVQIENQGTNQVDFNTYDFQVENSAGVLKNETYVPDVQNELSSGNLASGGKVTGNLAFEVPKGDAGLKLVFKPSFWSNKSVVVKL